eukprot:jgi/Galph1/1689/GphlegSOOS_G385.1
MDSDCVRLVPKELKDTWHEVIVRSYQLLSSVYSSREAVAWFNRQQLVSPAVVLWDKFQFDRKHINSWKQQFYKALNEEIVVIRSVSSSNVELYSLRTLTDMQQQVSWLLRTNENKEETDIIEPLSETVGEVAEYSIAKTNESSSLTKRERQEIEETPSQGDYTYEEVIDLLPPLYKKPPTNKVTLSVASIAKASLLTLDVNLLTVQGQKGYRSVRGSHGFYEGSWYFEVDILPGDGNVRIGWCTIEAEMEAPIGYDKYGYSIRDKTGDIFHEQRLVKYGESFGANDTIGCFLHLPDGPPNAKEALEIFERKWIAWRLYFSSPRRPCWSQQERIKPVPPELDIPKVGYMEFFKNGKSLGIAVQGVVSTKWYPAVSLYMNAKLCCNFGPNFKYPNIGKEYKPMSFAAMET